MEAMEHYVRHQGIHREAAKALATLLPQPASQSGRKLRQQLIEFVREAAQQAGPGERLLGSSEVLESIIGKYKQVAGERGQHGLTGIVLSLGALVGRLTVSAVHAAMTTVSNHDVWHWCRSHLGPTVQSLRRRIALALNPEQKQKPLPLPDS